MVHLKLRNISQCTCLLHQLVHVLLHGEVGSIGTHKVGSIGTQFQWTITGFMLGSRLKMGH